MNICFENYQNKIETVNYDMDVKKYDNIDKIAISKINKISGKIDIEKIDKILRIEFDLTADLIVISAYSLKEFQLLFPLKDELFFSKDKNDSSNEVILVDDNFNLDDVVYSLLISTLPLNIHQKDEQLPKGDGYSVLSEEEYEEEKEKFNDSSPFDVLKDIDL